MSAARRRDSRGAFIVFEGGDGAGKSTQAALLADRLTGDGYDVLLTRQPGGTPAGASIRALLLDPATGALSPRCEALLFAADKAQHVDEVIRPALAAGRIVVSDRYVDSSIAYQGAGRLLDPDEVARLNAWATGGLRPDLTVLLDVAPEVTVNLTERDRIESEGADFHGRLRAGFLRLAAAEPEHYVVVPARSGTPAELAAAIQPRVAALLAR